MINNSPTFKYGVFSFFILLANAIPENLNTLISGYVDYTYISRLSDKSLIDIPYRMAALKVEKRSNNMLLNGNFSIEYHVRDDAYFLGSSDPQDFIFDMRELYITKFYDQFEFRIGKQIHSWGSVDENSPVDNPSSLDYYYLFFGGIERKMATLSLAIDYYIGDLKLNTVFSPIHATNRIPLGNDDFPIELPVYPQASEIFPIQGLPYEGGIQGTFSTEFGDVSASYFSGYDRTFNLTGVNVYGHGSDISFPNVDVVYGYRKTDVIGLGGVLLNNWFTLRGDFGYFSTLDKNNSIERPSSFNPVYYDSLHFTYPLMEEATYFQSTYQLEAELPFGINLIAQYFTHDTLTYSSDSLPVDQEIDIPNLEIDPEEMEPSNFFTPGMGVPLAILTDRAFFLTLKKNMFDEQLKFSFTSMIDASIVKKEESDFNDAKEDHSSNGLLMELKLTYSFNQDLDGTIAITNINGDSDHPEGANYPFNRMEDFSHLRFELKYFF
tara:strand:- start:861 stop:2342 length:1482 start_codon:yes stop_codon:yes gene_type:complete